MADLMELVSFITVNLVDHPDDVTVAKAERQGREIYQVRVHPDDLGKVIGKGGAHASAIRTLMAAASGKEKKRYILEIIEH